MPLPCSAIQREFEKFGLTGNDETATRTILSDVSAYISRIDQTTTPGFIYLGSATPGSTTSESVWQIVRVDLSTEIVFLYADGNGDYDNIWDNRASLTYA